MMPQPEVVGIDSRPLKIYLHNKRSLFQSGGTRVRSNADQMGGSRLACARYTQDPNERGIGSIDASASAGVLSRGVGLRVFESHPPHQRFNLGTPTKLGKLSRADLIVGLIRLP